LLSPQISLFVQPRNCRPRSSNKKPCFLCPRLVNLLNHLERQNDVRYVARLAIPDKFHFALILEQQEPELIGQRLVGFYSG